MKTIRQQLLRALKTAGEATSDALIDQVDGLTRKQISENLTQFVQEKLATRRKDDTTGMPAYTLTALGVARIKAKDSAPKIPLNESEYEIPKPSVKQSLTDEPVAPTTEESSEVKCTNQEIANLKWDLRRCKVELEEVSKLCNKNAAEVIKAGNLYEAEKHRADDLSRSLEELQDDLMCGQQRLNEANAEIAKLNSEEHKLTELSKTFAKSRFSQIRNWAQARNLIAGSTAEKQCVKLFEEIGELAAGIARGQQQKIEDGIGDAVVVLTILAAQRGTTIEDCIDLAWDEIKNRKGEMRNGIFVKEADL